MQQEPPREIPAKKPFRDRIVLSNLNVGLFFFLALLTAILLLLGHFYFTDLKHEQRGALTNKLSVTADKIEDIITSRLYMLDELASHVQISPDINQAEFDHLAQSMLERDPSVRSLQLARNSVVSHVYPATGNVAALGHNLLTDITRKADTLLTLRTNTATISGPLTLRQGGTALVVRQPIQIRDNSTHSIETWGLSILVVDWHVILQQTDVLSLANVENLALRKRVDDKWKTAFWGNNKVFDNDVIIVDIQLPNSKWQLALYSPHIRISPLVWVSLIAFFILLLLIYFLLQFSRKLTWIAPAALAAAFALLCTTITGLSYYTISNEHQQEIHQLAESARAKIRSRLLDSLDYMLLLSLARTSNRLSANDFQLKVGQYVKDHPELINVTWVDETFTIRDVAPLECNKQIIGLRIDLEEPKRASHLAKELHLPVYTRPFVAIQGGASFEVWLPIFRGAKHLGFFAGVYSVPKLLKVVMSDESLKNTV